MRHTKQLQSLGKKGSIKHSFIWAKSHGGTKQRQKFTKSSGLLYMKGSGGKCSFNANLFGTLHYTWVIKSKDICFKRMITWASETWGRNYRDSTWKTLRLNQSKFYSGGKMTATGRTWICFHSFLNQNKQRTCSRGQYENESGFEWTVEKTGFFLFLTNVQFKQKCTQTIGKQQ